MNTIANQKELINHARLRSKIIFLAVDETVAQDISLIFSQLATELEEMMALNEKYQHGLALIADPLRIVNTPQAQEMKQIAREALE
jgi:hypothetical protein